MEPIIAYKHQELYGGIGGVKYEFKLNMWQLFESCYRDGYHDGKRCYRDFKKRGFHIAVVPRKSGWSMEIFAITVDKTVRAYAGNSAGNWRDRLRDTYGRD